MLRYTLGEVLRTIVIKKSVITNPSQEATSYMLVIDSISCLTTDTLEPPSGTGNTRVKQSTMPFQVLTVCYCPSLLSSSIEHLVLYLKSGCDLPHHTIFHAIKTDCFCLKNLGEYINKIEMFKVR